MRIQVLQHVAFEDEGRISLWARTRGHRISRTRLFLGDPFPPHDGFDALAIMGGPMGVYDYGAFPWLLHEKTFILDAISSGIPVLGICLGAQLIADVMGGRVTKNAVREIGWFPVSTLPAARAAAPFGHFPETFEALHWHGDTFAIPPGALRLASSEACANQAFIAGDRVIGLQFHLEYSRRSIRTMIAECAAELIPDRYVQPPERLLRDASSLHATRSLLFPLLDAWSGARPDQKLTAIQP